MLKRSARLQTLFLGLLYCSLSPLGFASSSDGYPSEEGSGDEYDMNKKISKRRQKEMAAEQKLREEDVEIKKIKAQDTKRVDFVQEKFSKIQPFNNLKRLNKFIDYCIKNFSKKNSTEQEISEKINSFSNLFLGLKDHKSTLDNLTLWISVLPDFFAEKLINKDEKFFEFFVREKPEFFEKAQWLLNLDLDISQREGKKIQLEFIPDYAVEEFLKWFDKKRLSTVFDLYRKTPEIIQKDVWIIYFLKNSLDGLLKPRKLVPDQFQDALNSNFIQEEKEDLLKVYKIISSEKELIKHASSLPSFPKDKFKTWLNDYKKNLDLNEIKKDLESTLKSELHLISSFFYSQFRLEHEKINEHLKEASPDELRKENDSLCKLLAFENLIQSPFFSFDSNHGDLNQESVKFLNQLPKKLQIEFKKWFDSESIVQLMLKEPGLPLFKTEEHFLSFFLNTLKKTSLLSQIKSYLSKVDPERLQKENKILINYLEFLSTHKDRGVPQNVSRSAQKEIIKPKDFVLPPGVKILRSLKEDEKADFISLVLSSEDIEKYLKCYIKGQDEAVENLVRPIHRYLTGIALEISKREMERTAIQKTPQKPNILVIGPTGCGKTEMLRKISELLDIPIFIADASELTPAGYHGGSIEDSISLLVSDAIQKGQATDSDKIIRFEKGAILVLDEIDKLGGGDKKFTGQTQSQLLKVIEGKVIEIKRKERGSIFVHTDNILFIGTGAFSGHVDYEKSIATKDLEKAGMKVELLGRFPHLLQLKPLGAEGLHDILKNSISSPLKICQESLKEGYGIAACFSEEAELKICEYASKNRTGTRGLVGISGQVTDGILEIQKKIQVHLEELWDYERDIKNKIKNIKNEGKEIEDIETLQAELNETEQKLKDIRDGLKNQETQFGVDFVERVIEKSYKSLPIEKLEAIEKKTIEELHAALSKGLFGVEKEVGKFISSVKYHYSSLLYSARKNKSRRGAKEVPFLINAPRAADASLVIKRLKKTLDVPFSVISAVNLLKNPGDSLVRSLRELLEQSDFNPRRAEQGIIQIYDMEYFIPPLGSKTETIWETQKIFSRFLSSITDQSYTIPNADKNKKDEDFKFHTNSILFIFSANSYKDPDKEIINTDFFKQYIQPSTSNLILFNPKTTKDYLNELESEDSIVKQEQQFLGEQYNIKMIWNPEASAYLADWAVKNEFGFKGIENAITSTSRTIIQQAEKQKAKENQSGQLMPDSNSGSMLQSSMLENKSNNMTSIEVNKKLLEKDVEPNLSRKSDHPWANMYV